MWHLVAVVVVVVVVLAVVVIRVLVAEERWRCGVRRRRPGSPRHRGRRKGMGLKFFVGRMG